MIETTFPVDISVIRIYLVTVLFVCFLQKPTWEYDIYLAYSHKEQWEASILTEEWTHKGFSVFKDSQAVNDKKAWQEEIYEVSKLGHLKHLSLKQCVYN